METPEVAAIIVQDNDGGRIACKYFNKKAFPDMLSRTEFEKKLHKKTKNTPAKIDTEVFLMEGMNVLYRSGVDITFFVIGSAEENELILASVLDALTNAMLGLLKGVLDKRTVMQQLELLMLSMDELVDGGIPLELDPTTIESRVMLRGAVPESISAYNELTVGAIMDKARDKLAKQFIK